MRTIVVRQTVVCLGVWFLVGGGGVRACRNRCNYRMYNRALECFWSMG